MFKAVIGWFTGTSFYKWVLLILSGIIGILGFLFYYKNNQKDKLEVEVNSLEKENQILKDKVTATDKAISDSKNKKKIVTNVEKNMMDIDKQVHEKIKEEKRIKKGQKVTFGKSLSILIICFILSGCGYTLEQCRAKYPCTENVCLEVSPPVITKIQRPQLNVFDVDYNETLDRYVFTYEQVEAILSNEEMLSEMIKGYELKIDIYNEWRLNPNGD